MDLHKLLCYKLCYCLGVSDSGLNRRFEQVHSAAKRISYFNGKDATNTIRAAMHIYFLVVRYYSSYVDADTLTSAAGKTLHYYTQNSKVDIESLFEGRKSLDDFLRQLGIIVQDNLNDAYKELELELNFLDFCSLLSIPDTSHQKLMQVQFMLERLPPDFNIYFYCSEVLNHDCMKMLSVDDALHKRLDIAFGKHETKSVDHSALFVEVQSDVDNAFVHFSDLCKFSKIIVDASSVAEAMYVLLYDFVSRDKVEICSSLEEAESIIDSESALILHYQEEELNTLLGLMQKTVVILTMPLPSRTFKLVTKHHWQNTFLLSMKDVIQKSDK